MLFRSRRLAADDAVVIVARDGIEAGVKIGARLACHQHRNRIRPQIVIECVADFFGRERLLKIEMRDLAEGVHTRIRAARR